MPEKPLQNRSFGRFLRFSGAAAFVAHRKISRKDENAFFASYVAPAEKWRFAIVVSKARIGGAVQRNKAKRRLRAALAEAAQGAEPKGIILYAKRSVLTADYQELVAALKRVV